MINAFIFFLHFIFILYIFTKKWQDESIQSSFINLALITLLFTVGWAISSSVTQIFIDKKGLGIYYDRDAISLTLLAVVEYFFYKLYYFDEKTDKKEVKPEE
jgi:uncharacterized membrane protein